MKQFILSLTILMASILSVQAQTSEDVFVKIENLLNKAQGQKHKGSVLMLKKYIKVMHQTFSRNLVSISNGDGYHKDYTNIDWSSISYSKDKLFANDKLLTLTITLKQKCNENAFDNNGDVYSSRNTNYIYLYVLEKDFDAFEKLYHENWR